MDALDSALYSADETREIDRATIEDFGIDGFTLMEIAATRAADFILSRFPEPVRVLAVCGKGNNAGDALAVCRLLAGQFFKTDIHFAFGKSGLSADAGKNLKLLKKMGAEDIGFPESPDFSQYDLILDGLFGTGINSAIKGNAAGLVEAINNAGVKVCAMDIPSGIHGSTGEIMGCAVKADYTCMFGTRKLGCYLGDGPGYCGERVFCRLPFPPHIMKMDYPVQLIRDDDNETQNRVKAAHKYEAGIVYVIGGSPGLTGAAILAAKAAWSAGCGAVTVITPAGLSPAFDAHLVEQMRYRCGVDSDEIFKPGHVSEILEVIREKPGVVLLGPGLGRNPDTIEFTASFLKIYTGKLVLDADGLFALSQRGTGILNPESTCILTPHPGELNRLHPSAEISPVSLRNTISGYPTPENITITAKGNPTIAAGLHECGVTGYDTSDFARAGFGDVLAGAISGIFSYTPSPIKSCYRALKSGRQRMLEKQPKQFISPSDLL